jgi:hypothetical protein
MAASYIFIALEIIYCTGMYIQWNLDLSFFKGLKKTNDEYGETINPVNLFFLTKSRLGRILPQLKI